MNTRTDIINYLIETYDYNDYLEVGVRDCRSNFDKVKASYKVGVDPEPKRKNDLYPFFEMTSDEFFKQNKQKFDIVFIDGMHEHSFAARDLQNSLDYLRENGTVVMHDCNPPTEWHQREPEEYNGTGEWNGTVWKAFVQFRKRKDLKMCVVDTDWGVGIIQFGEQIPLQKTNKLLYSLLEKNRQNWLNLVTPKEFPNWIDK